jgi:hypothetical protein
LGIKVVTSSFHIRAAFSLQDVPLIKEFFLKPFREKKNYFQFAHEVDLDYNDMYKFASAIFENPDSLHENSKNITRHLFEQSITPY